MTNVCKLFGASNEFKCGDKGLKIEARNMFHGTGPGKGFIRR